jgi:hypothetical protein
LLFLTPPPIRVTNEVDKRYGTANRQSGMSWLEASVLAILAAPGSIETTQFS